MDQQKKATTNPSQIATDAGRTDGNATPGSSGPKPAGAPNPYARFGQPSGPGSECQVPPGFNKA